MNLYFFVVNDPYFKRPEKGKELAGADSTYFQKDVIFSRGFHQPVLDQCLLFIPSEVF